MPVHGAAAVSARTISAKVLIFAATTPYSPRLNLALVVAVELRLCCWPGGYGDTKTIGCQVGLAGENLEQMLFFYYFISFLLLCFVADEEQRKSEGADSSGCRAGHKIDSTFARWCFLLLVASAACCCCMPRPLLLLLLLLQVGLAAARLWASCRSFCC